MTSTNSHYGTDGTNGTDAQSQRECTLPGYYAQVLEGDRELFEYWKLYVKIGLLNPLCQLVIRRSNDMDGCYSKELHDSIGILNCATAIELALQTGKSPRYWLETIG